MISRSIRMMVTSVLSALKAVISGAGITRKWLNSDALLVKVTVQSIPPLAIFFAVCLSASVSVAGVTGQKTQIPVAAKVSWDELIALDVLAKSQPSANQVVIPFMKIPEVSDLSRIDIPAIQPDALNAPGALGFDPAATAPVLLVNFLGLPDNASVIPPDTHGAVGLNHIVTMLNSDVRIQNRTGSEISTVSSTTFWSPAGASGVFDPRILYDPSAGRWIATIDSDSRSAASSVLFAISDTDDPTGNWTFYRIDADGTDINWADFPDIGYNNTWIAITNNMFAVADNAFGGAAMWVIDKSTALAGGALTVSSFTVGFDVAGGNSGSTLRVCQTFGAEAILHVVNRSFTTSGGVHMLRLSEISGSGASPTWSAASGSIIAGSGLFTVSNDFNGSQIGASQLGTTERIATNNPRLINAVFRNGHIYTTHSGGLPATGTADRTSVFWYELDPTALPSPIVQSGVIDGGDDVHHFFPSIAANVNGDIVIGFSRSDATRFAEAVFAGRLAADAPGTMGPVTVLKAGEDSYIKTFGGATVRWGDYSATVVDPVDDSSFWTIQEYAALDVNTSPNGDRWSTWWGNLSFTPLDTDGDGVADFNDNCPTDFNPGQEDSDLDGNGDACDICPGFDDFADSDGDGVPTGCDNCPLVPNAGQMDTDGDGTGDACDICPGFDDALDADGDGFPDGCDICPGFNDRFDADGDGVPDGCDICPGFNDTADSDGDGVPDGCDICAGFDDALDSDGDGVPDGCDICAGFDDAIDTDSDGVPDGCDICAGFDDAIDTDSDGVPDGCDICAGFDDAVDSDGDSVPDGCDICPGFDDSIDSDGDGIPDGCDTSCCIGTTGNVDDDPADIVDISDLTVLIDHLFINFPPLACPEEGNVDGDPLGVIDISDLTVLIDHLFINFPPTAACQ